MSKQIEAETLRTWLDEQRPVTVVDVRNDDARAQWSIPGSLHVNAYDDLREGRPGPLEKAPLPDNQPIVVVCNAGRTSQIAVDVLAGRGINAFSLAGGMKAWSLAWNTADVPLTASSAQVIQVRRTGKGCLSYLIGSDGEAAVIDASVSPEVYLDLARRQGWRIRHVIETHIHADHLSRARLVAERSGAALHLPDQQRVHFPFTAVRDGGRISVGRASLVARHTPGHTAESMSYLLDGEAAFTGDTLFTRAVGRPDLGAGPAGARQRAVALFGSLNALRGLAPQLIVLPAHTDDPVPFDGKPIAARMADVEPWLSRWLSSENAFIDRVMSGLPEPPASFARIIESNEAGELPAGDPAELEAGANRCAVS